MIAGLRLAALLHAAVLVALAASDGALTAIELTVVGTWVLVPWVAHRLRGPASSEGHWSAVVSGLGWLALVVAGLTAGGEAHWWALPVIGFGVALRLAAIRRLGARYSDGITPVGPIETGGVYRWLRHPGEIGQLAIAYGSAAALGSIPAMAIATLVLTPLALWRLGREERALGEAARGDHRPPRAASAEAAFG